MDIRSGQMLAWDNKIAKGFNTTDVPLEFCLLQSEVAEAFDSWRKGRVDVGEELADAAIFLFGLAQMTGVDLDEEIEAKIAKNAGRDYRQLPNGVLAKSASSPAWPAHLAQAWDFTATPQATRSRSAGSTGHETERRAGRRPGRAVPCALSGAGAARRLRHR